MGINYTSLQGRRFYRCICQKHQLCLAALLLAGRCACARGARAGWKGYAGSTSKGQQQWKGTRDVPPREAAGETVRYKRAVGSSRGALTGQLYFISQSLITAAGLFPCGGRVQRARPTGEDMADALSSWAWWLGSLMAGL